MVRKEEIGIFVADVLKDAVTRVKDDYVEEAIEDRRYSDAAIASVLHGILNTTLSAAEIRLREMLEEEE